MATLVLQTAGSTLGGLLGPVGGAIGAKAASALGAGLDKALFSASPREVQGPRLTALHGIASTEGAPIPRVYGRVRLGGQMIWATRFDESATVARSGGNGGKSTGMTASSSSGGTQTTTYSYFANFAIGLCEGPVAGLRRVWADGRELDLTTVTMRLYRGDESQMPDPLIVAKEGASAVPAYRGLAYVVFERMPLADFGNRIPQLSFEVMRPVDGLAQMVRAVDLIPGASEYAYAPTAFTRRTGPCSTASENRHMLSGASDWQASLDALQALCPNLKSVALVVAWFGDDLRAGQCTCAPRVEANDKVVIGASWSVAGLSRGAARAVSRVNGTPAYGGTPSDDVVTAALRDLSARGLSVTFYPFLMMDIAPGNTLADPWTGNASQPAFPWRGRVTCDPAPGRAGSVEGTAVASSQIGAFFGSASPSTAEWSYRRFVLYYAGLCARTGGVSAFLVGSELAAMTRVSSAPGSYPAALALAQLASDVKALVGQGVKVSYSADWTEYGADVRNNGADLRFPLDVVWGAPSVDFIGIDAYPPLSDWRDGETHLDRALAETVYDRDYLGARLTSGEAFDWYYADDVARRAQHRSAIVDGAFAQPWTYRAKDLVGWWSNPHVERMNGVALAAPTAYVPKSKPIWLMEIGCPAVDRGANAPNAFPDPKSSASTVPPFSRGFRDDLMQTRVLEAWLSHFDPAQPGFSAANNPVSPIYGGPMVDPARIHLWAWDARPFPAFPNLGTVWSDGSNWETGHWLNGRLEGLALDRLVRQIVRDLAVVDIDLPKIDGFLDGYVLDQAYSARGALQTLAALFGFDLSMRGGRFAFVARTGASVATIGTEDLVPGKDGTLVALTRVQESELPRSLSLGFSDGDGDYRAASALSRQLVGGSLRDTRTDTGAVLSRAEAQRRADIWLQDLWVARERADFSVRPGLLALETGDHVALTINGSLRPFRIERIVDASARTISARAIEPGVFDHAPVRVVRPLASVPPIAGPPRVEILDLALATSDPAVLQWAAVTADPWTGPVSVFADDGAGGFDFVTSVAQPAGIGLTLDPLGPGPVARIDCANAFRVQLDNASPTSVEDVRMFGGTNMLALRGPDGACEMIGFAKADLVGAGVWLLSRVLRGLGGEEALAARSVPAGATVVLLDQGLVPIATGPTALGRTRRFRFAPAGCDIADPNTVEIVATPGAKALMPLSPVRVRATRGAAGVTITFLRRGRRDADAWEPVDIPLGEDAESYVIDIRQAGNVVRTITTNTTTAIYPASIETVDFGAAQTALDVVVCQVSASAGRGFPFAGIVPVN